MRSVVLAALLCVATSAHAAPWSFELPAGYTEVPDAAVHDKPWAPDITIDAQVYESPDHRVRLIRQTMLYKLDEPPTRDILEGTDQGFLMRAKDRGGKTISVSREFHGDQLVADQVHDLDEERFHYRRIYAADTSRVVHVFGVTCSGPADQLAACEKAQQSMVLMLPNQAPLDMTIVTPKRKPDRTFLFGQLTGGAIVLALVIWYVVRRRQQAAERG